MKTGSELRFFLHDIKGYVFFIIIFPLTCYLWFRELHSIKYTLLIISLPIIVSYLIPYFGTNVLKLWEFKSHAKFGNMPFHHGVSLGSCINLFGFICFKLSPHYKDNWDSIFFSMVVAALITFWNYDADIRAVKHGYLTIHNKASYEHKHPYEIVYDYAVPYFYTFGTLYGLYIKLIQYYMTNQVNWLFVIFYYIDALFLPTIVYAISSYIRNKNFGILPFIPEDEKKK